MGSVIFYCIINSEFVLSLLLYKHCLIGSLCAGYRRYKNITMTDSDFLNCCFFGME